MWIHFTNSSRSPASPNSHGKYPLFTDLRWSSCCLRRALNHQLVTWPLTDRQVITGRKIALDFFSINADRRCSNHLSSGKCQKWLGKQRLFFLHQTQPRSVSGKRRRLCGVVFCLPNTWTPQPSYSAPLFKVSPSSLFEPSPSSSVVTFCRVMSRSLSA